jgi:DNA-binding CsgD family transcriptional regulator
MSLRELDTLHPMPGISLWKKNTQSIFVDVNQEYARLFGFKRVDDVIGKTDADLPCRVANIADVIQHNDQEVIKNKEAIKFLEILQVANDEWKILLIVKTPYYENHQIAGTSSYCIEMPYLNYKQLGIHSGTSSFKQASFRIIDANQLFTQKEIECLFLFLRQKTVSEMSFLLAISPKIVEMHLSSIKTKMGCYTDLQLRKEAMERNYCNIIPGSLLQGGLSNFSSYELAYANAFEDLHITKRQLDCLFHLVQGMTVKEIGKALQISPRTVEDHLNIIKKRLQCSSRSALISKAFTLKAIKERLILS